MDAIQFLKHQHQEAKAAFGKLFDAAPTERGAIWKKLAPELARHEQIEDRCLYGPVARESGATDPQLSRWVSKGHPEEVHTVEGLIQQTQGLDPKDERWLAAVLQIRTALERHIAEEEQDAFPRVGRVWDRARLEQAGEQMSEMAGDKSERAGRR
ncbi:MAG TPA: hemerythrin domain-containing protein [Candidatus Bathyarchaeia archaeon]|nr:hemerythrin domain-containing protein [Candidatus Bathyarchaeia archaeon]